jgi:leader peptidase (prepilin peptidase)/N-methyltransferase
VSDNRLWRSLAADRAILRSLSAGERLTVGVVSVICAATGFALFDPATGTATLIFGILAVVIAACDARQQLIPDVLSFALFVCGFAAAAALAPEGELASALITALAGAVIGAALLGGLRLAWLRLRHVEAIGYGDVKLAAAAGAWLGPVDLCTALLLATLAALAVAALSSIRKAPAIDRVPFAAFLAPASWLVFVLTRL